MHRMASGWGMVCALALGVWGCDGGDGDDPADARPEPAIDGSITPDVAVTPDAAPVVDAEVPPDMAVEPMGGCDDACERLSRCAIERCDGVGADDAAAVEAACTALCDETPQLASVLNGADGCGTVVEFGRDRLPDQLGEACRVEVEPDPLPTDIPCPYPCEDGEQCLGGFCVRDDGTCVTDYHCRPDSQTCEDGRCVPAQFAECRAADACGERQECRVFSADPFAPGLCIYPCETDADCPYSESCQAALGGICYFDFCGPGTGNGGLYGSCNVGALDGTCYPLSEGQARQGQPGYCIEAGTAAVGAPCDNAAEGRDAESAALRCTPGALCFADGDDPLDPSDVNDEQGECVNLCDPRAADPCGAGEICLDFSQPDDPATEFDETQYIGVCYRSDCSVFGGEGCAAGQACRILTVTTPAGRCVPDGVVPVGEPCETIDDCAGTAICGGNNRDMQVCIALCDPEAAGACPAEQFCYGEAGQAVGFCIYPGGDFPAPDGGMPEPDAGVELDMGPAPDGAAEPDAGPR